MQFSGMTDNLSIKNFEGPLSLINSTSEKTHGNNFTPEIPSLCHESLPLMKEKSTFWNVPVKSEHCIVDSKAQHQLPEWALPHSFGVISRSRVLNGVNFNEVSHPGIPAKAYRFPCDGDRGPENTEMFIDSPVQSKTPAIIKCSRLHRKEAVSHEIIGQKEGRPRLIGSRRTLSFTSFRIKMDCNTDPVRRGKYQHHSGDVTFKKRTTFVDPSSEQLANIFVNLSNNYSEVAHQRRIDSQNRLVIHPQRTRSLNRSNAKLSCCIKGVKQLFNIMTSPFKCDDNRRSRSLNSRDKLRSVAQNVESKIDSHSSMESLLSSQNQELHTGDTFLAGAHLNSASRLTKRGKNSATLPRNTSAFNNSRTVRVNTLRTPTDHLIHSFKVNDTILRALSNSPKPGSMQLLHNESGKYPTASFNSTSALPEKDITIESFLIKSGAHSPLAIGMPFDEAATKCVQKETLKNLASSLGVDDLATGSSIRVQNYNIRRSPLLETSDQRNGVIDHCLSDLISDLKNKEPELKFHGAIGESTLFTKTFRTSKKHPSVAALHVARKRPISSISIHSNYKHTNVVNRNAKSPMSNLLNLTPETVSPDKDAMHNLSQSIDSGKQKFTGFLQLKPSSDVKSIQTSERIRQQAASPGLDYKDLAPTTKELQKSYANLSACLLPTQDQIPGIHKQNAVSLVGETKMSCDEECAKDVWDNQVPAVSLTANEQLYNQSFDVGARITPHFEHTTRSNQKNELKVKPHEPNSGKLQNVKVKLTYTTALKVTPPTMPDIKPSSTPKVITTEARVEGDIFGKKFVCEPQRFNLHFREPHASPPDTKSSPGMQSIADSHNETNPRPRILDDDSIIIERLDEPKGSNRNYGKSRLRRDFSSTIDDDLDEDLAAKHEISSIPSSSSEDDDGINDVKFIHETSESTRTFDDSHWLQKGGQIGLNDNAHHSPSVRFPRRTCSANSLIYSKVGSSEPIDEHWDRSEFSKENRQSGSMKPNRSELNNSKQYPFQMDYSENTIASPANLHGEPGPAFEQRWNLDSHLNDSSRDSIQRGVSLIPFRLISGNKTATFESVLFHEMNDSDGIVESLACHLENTNDFNDALLQGVQENCSSSRSCIGLFERNIELFTHTRYNLSHVRSNEDCPPFSRSHSASDQSLRISSPVTSRKIITDFVGNKTSITANNTPSKRSIYIPIRSHETCEEEKYLISGDGCKNVKATHNSTFRIKECGKLFTIRSSSAPIQRTRSDQQLLHGVLNVCESGRITQTVSFAKCHQYRNRQETQFSCYRKRDPIVDEQNKSNLDLDSRKYFRLCDRNGDLNDRSLRVCTLPSPIGHAGCLKQTESHRSVCLKTEDVDDGSAKITAVKPRVTRLSRLTNGKPHFAHSTRIGSYNKISKTRSRLHSSDFGIRTACCHDQARRMTWTDITDKHETKVNVRNQIDACKQQRSQTNKQPMQMKLKQRTRIPSV